MVAPIKPAVDYVSVPTFAVATPAAVAAPAVPAAKAATAAPTTVLAPRANKTRDAKYSDMREYDMA